MILLEAKYNGTSGKSMLASGSYSVHVAVAYVDIMGKV